MHPVQVDEEASPGHLGRIEERERTGSTSSARGNSFDTPGGGSSAGGGILPWRGRLGSGGQRRSGRVGRMVPSAREADGDEESVLVGSIEEKAAENDNRIEQGGMTRRSSTGLGSRVT